MNDTARDLLRDKFLKVLYGCMKSGLIWYKLFLETLSRDGFVLSPYDLCITNKTIEGKQCTLNWYVNDLKISHVKSSVVDSVIVTIESYFEKITVTIGKKHTYVGIEIEFIGDMNVTLFQKDYLLDCINTFGEDVSTCASSLKRDNLVLTRMTNY